MGTHHASWHGTSNHQHPLPRDWAVFAILVALMIVDYVDRQIVVSMFSHLREQWELSDRQLGALVSAVSITVAVGALPLSLLADRWSRVRSIFLMALVWSLATIGCAFAGSYAQLIGTRAIVGLGEAAYGTVGVALLATLFPSRMRSTVLGAFLAASMVGSLLGVVLGGVIAERLGWQAGFGLAGVPGLLLAAMFVAVAREDRPPRWPAHAPDRDRIDVRRVARELMSPRSIPLACLGAGLQLLAVSTIYAWLPTYLHRYYGYAPDRAGIQAAIVVLAGGLGAVAWSAYADRLTARSRKARLHVPAGVAIGTALALGPAFALVPVGALQFALLVAGGLLMAGTIGPVAAAVVDVAPQHLRATASAVLAVTQNLIGLAGGPLLTGALSDRYGLATAMAFVPLACLPAAALFLLAAHWYARDIECARESGVERRPLPAAGPA